MSEQIIKNEPGIGRVISKKVTPIERSTPNIIAFEGRLAAVETAPNSAAGVISFNDFTNGTLIKTDINISGTNGPSINFEITGKSYSISLPPHVINGQTYLYNDTYYSSSVSSNILAMGIVTLLMDGDGFFNIWFPRIGYWNSFSTMVWISSVQGEKVNRVTGYEDVSKPASTKFLDVTTIQNWNSANDGPNSGLNADLLDGHEASDFMLLTNTDVMVSKFANTEDLNNIVNSGSWRIQNTNLNKPAGYDWGQVLVIHGAQDTIAQMIFSAGTSEVSVRTGNPSIIGGVGDWANWAKVWTDKNHGDGSGLDADLLDGEHASHFAVHNHNHNTTYLGLTAKAADSNKLDGNLASYFLPADHNAVSATKLKTSRAINLTGDVTGAVYFDGTHNADILTSITPGLIPPIVAVRFNGYTAAIDCSKGVSQVVRLSKGHYQIFFTNPFPNTKYVISGLVGGDGNDDWHTFLNVYNRSSQLVGSCVVRSREVPNDDTKAADCNNIHVMITYIG